MKERFERNSSIELLRVIAIIGVIILHYNSGEMGGGFRYVKEGSINQYFLYITENLFICAVDLFILISAYFLSITKKRNFIKIVELIIQVIFFRCIFYVISIFVYGTNFSAKGALGCLLPQNYFVILYSVLYMLSPYINLLIEKLDKKYFTKLLVMLLGIFSVWTIVVDFLENIKGEALNGLSTVGMYGSQYGFSIVNFILIYFVGAYIRINKINLKKKTMINLSILIFIFLFVSSIIEHKIGLVHTTTWNYNNPFVILFATLIFLLFKDIRLKNKIINELARGTFTCFLFHGYFITKLHIENVVNDSIFTLIIHQICVAIFLYLISYIVYKIYEFCSKWFIKLIIPICEHIDISVSL